MDGGTRHEAEAAGGMEKKRQAPGIGREEQTSAHPGPDPVHPEASRLVGGRTPQGLRDRQERNKERSKERNRGRTKERDKEGNEEHGHDS
ncbi:hypothetical protein EDD96_0243 [Streptomyces sp. Ag109_G2-6]|uniref:hypothetical protein n=1 Tax=Streptomyces TaxID=1883 RepID=UPI0009A496F0|nr:MULTISPECIES: hypothetical protein [Streptomyces]RPF43734.1 hypothetical protein EDD96_0243 [Streptomyces sp. Ag109_G2-6]